MNKKFLLLGLVFAVILSFITSVYAWDSYSDWYNNYWNTGSSSGSNSASSDSDIYHLSYYPPNMQRTYSMDTSETTHTLVDEYQDPWNYDKKSTTVVVIDNTEKESIIPVYNRHYTYYSNTYPRYNYNPSYSDAVYTSGHDYNPAYDYDNDNDPSYHFMQWCKTQGSPYTSWKYKNTYDGVQRYDPCEGYYNYRN
jgi:hypothetical protein